MRDGAGLDWGEVHWERVDASHLTCYPMRIEWESLAAGQNGGLSVDSHHRHWPAPEVIARPVMPGDPVPTMARKLYASLSEALGGRAKIRYARGTSMTRGKPGDVVDSIAVTGWSDVGAAAAVWTDGRFTGAWVRPAGEVLTRADQYAVVSMHPETGKRRRESGPATVLGWLKGERG